MQSAAYKWPSIQLVRNFALKKLESNVKNIEENNACVVYVFSVKLKVMAKSAQPPNIYKNKDSVRDNNFLRFVGVTLIQ